MTEKQFHSLDLGDIIRSSSTNTSYIVSQNYRTHVIAVKTVDVTNPNEWILVAKAEHKDPKL